MDLFGALQEDYKSGSWVCLTGVSGAENDAKKSMLAFCKEILQMTKVAPKADINHTFVFSGPQANEKEGYRGYAPAFAKYIRENGLGTLTESHPFHNAYYTGKTSQVFCWTPDMKALWEWFQVATTPQPKPDVLKTVDGPFKEKEE